MVFKTNYRLMQVISIAESFCNTFELPFVINIIVLSILSGRFTKVFSVCVIPDC